MSVCAHYLALESQLAPPTSTQDVYKEESLHRQRTGHSLFVTLNRTRKEREPITKLQVVEVPEEEEFTYEVTPRCMSCDDQTTGRVLPLTPLLDTLSQAILSSRSSAQKAEVQAWEEEVTSCQHTEALHSEPHALDLSKAQCAECDLTTNLWMCLTCGNLGCGRAQFGGVAGNSHGLAHFQASGHPCSVKQGTITAEGTGDVYCYACNEARTDPKLAQHLAEFGMNVAHLNKTEKSMTELQLEQNARFDFTMTLDDGRPLEPLYGPGHTGLRNLGNSCYMASVLQSLFALPEFQQRFNTTTHRNHVAHCAQNPAKCLECQLGKLGDGLLSGRYAVPRPHTEPPAFQLGIKPLMLKSLLGSGHPEFSTMRQQDADEFLQYFVGQVHTISHAPSEDPTSSMAFALEHRLQCTRCDHVRYTTEVRDAGIALPVPVQERPSEDRHADAASGKLYEPVSLEASFDLFTAPESLSYHCPECKADVVAKTQTRFKTFPKTLIIQAQRFQLENWVPQKVNVPFQVPLTTNLNLKAYQGQGIQPGEESLPDDQQPEKQEVDQEALSMLTAMGFSENRAKRALSATNGDTETAANWLFERMDDASLDLPLNDDKPDTSMLEEMGFTSAQASKALRLTGNCEAAVAWLFEHPDDRGDTNESEQSVSPTSTTVPGLDTAPEYRLASFVTHRGPSVHSGHYVAHVRQGSNQWAFFNDEKVAKAPLESEADKGANDASVTHLSELYVCNSY
ncbi:ubiquitinyl hydrolase 1 [Malassezia psittaci]|uniref:Ubiquitin carboxyl-terminal hydrolase n=1 Tax=Malassezia psittaci TaxID=1821823 RepID=A0AAF0FAD1_9BASI|nr:ubiquitinyl hydrolase 1 [Malassezia psittaci]